MNIGNVVHGNRDDSDNNSDFGIGDNDGNISHDVDGNGAYDGFEERVHFYPQQSRTIWTHHMLNVNPS